MITIVQYDAGNIDSVKNSLNRLGKESIVTDDPNKIKLADKVILPGVGEASSAMNSLKQNNLDKIIASLTQPVLGICLGMQLMCDFSEEGAVDCLGIFKTQVKLFPSTADAVPHMGWDNFQSIEDTPIFKGLDVNDDVYYAHSYYAGVCDDTIAICDYILPFSAALQKNNFYGTQFHPEKSAHIGEQILLNFLAL